VTELIGKMLGPYQILERIGEGGMAVVYKGYQAPLDRYVAIKVLRGELTRDETFVTRFRREALAVARLDHPNILHVYDAGATDGVYYIAMAYVDGGSLRERIDQGPLEVDLAVSIAAQLADALDHAHRHDLIHRDVKPSNILLSRSMRPMLADFGIAKVLYEATRLTRTGVSFGTPEYMAPEHALMQPVDARTDIYALGVVLYEMLCGEVPFVAATPVVTLYRHVNDALPPLRRKNTDVPKWLEAVLGRALAKRPQDRYQRARELADDLERRQATTVGRLRSTVRLGGTAWPPTARNGLGRGPAILGAIGLLLAVLLLGGISWLDVGGGQESGSPTAIPTASVLAPADVATTTAPTPTPTSSATGTSSPTASATPTSTDTPTPTSTESPSPSATATALPTRPPATEPPATQPPATRPPATEPPATLQPTRTPVRPTPTKPSVEPAVTVVPNASATSDTPGVTPP
jgi:serine/threonine protein kinase